LFGLLIKGIIGFFTRKKAEKEGKYSLFQSLANHLGVPLSYFLPIFLLNLMLPLMQLSKSIFGYLEKTLEISLIICFSWLLIRGFSVAHDFVLFHFDYSKENNLRERKIRTQLIYLRQVLTGLIIVLTIAAILLSFSTMRRIGAGLLTGVGIGGIVIGFAAQRSLANLLAGFQIAFTQPIRIDDVVVVEGEWGRVEEITLTYVVINIWDERRLVLPITYFIEKPFQNWTRNSAQLIGSVFIYTDYSVPVDPVRKELERLVTNHPLWDKRVVNLMVTNTSERAIELRALVSASNSSAAFDLRCFVRENLVAFIQSEFPGALPRIRSQVDGEQLPKRGTEPPLENRS
jgi:small-conductance mechanosensitive channel